MNSSEAVDVVVMTEVDEEIIADDEGIDVKYDDAGRDADDDGGLVMWSLLRY